MNFHTIGATVALTAVLVSVCASGDAMAVPRVFVQNATGACQAALPVFDGHIRKRPLAVQNEGTAPAFVSCSFLDPTLLGSTGVTNVFLYADNNTGAPVVLACTLVTGFSNYYPTYYPKSITMNSGINLIIWDATDNAGNNFNNYTINVSCNLPAGTGLSASFLYYDA
jgi:hypothetical protein